MAKVIIRLNFLSGTMVGNQVVLHVDSIKIANLDYRFTRSKIDKEAMMGAPANNEVVQL